MASTITWIDAAYPPKLYPEGAQGLAFYIGGDTPHVWTPAEIQACHYVYRLPIFVRSNPVHSEAGEDVNLAITRLNVIGAPKGIIVAWDSETSVDPRYIGDVYKLLSQGGYKMMDYGSNSTVFGNDIPDGYYWGADWTNRPHIDLKTQMTQWESAEDYDTDLSTKALPWWKV